MKGDKPQIEGDRGRAPIKAAPQPQFARPPRGLPGASLRGPLVGRAQRWTAAWKHVSAPHASIEHGDGPKAWKPDRSQRLQRSAAQQREDWCIGGRQHMEACLSAISIKHTAKDQSYGSRIALSGCNEVHSSATRTLMHRRQAAYGSMPHSATSIEHTATDQRYGSRIALSGCNEVQLCNARIDTSVAGNTWKHMTKSRSTDHTATKGSPRRREAGGMAVGRVARARRDGRASSEARSGTDGDDRLSSTT